LAASRRFFGEGLIIIMVKCAVNGFGRIGRLVFRYGWEDPDLDIVHVNDLCSCESAAYLLKFDSVHGTWNHKVRSAEDGKSFTVDETTVTFSQEKDFTNVDWRALGVELVMEWYVTTGLVAGYLYRCEGRKHDG
jgi:glyceraldehyde 3-phosphate dehydrogenase